MSPTHGRTGGEINGADPPKVCFDPSGMGTISTRYVFHKSKVVVERLRRNDNATVFCLTALFAVVAGVVVVVVGGGGGGDDDCGGRRGFDRGRVKEDR